jgi:hypothetical protein
LPGANEGEFCSHVIRIERLQYEIARSGVHRARNLGDIVLV